MTSIYRYILKQSWAFAWKYRWLSIFGLFAALLGNGGIFNILINNFNSVQRHGEYITDLSGLISQGNLGAFIITSIEVIKNINITSAILLTVLLILILALLWVALVSQGGLISGLYRLQKKQQPSLNESWLRGKSKWIPVLGLNIIGKLATYVVIVVIGLPFFFLFVATQSLVWQWVLLILSFIIFIPFAIVVAFLIKFALIFVVAKNSEFRMSLVESWQLFKKNWIVSIETALILFIINILAGFGLLIVLFVIAAPFLFLGFIANAITSNILFWISITLGTLVVVAAVLTFGAFFATFQTGVWVTLFTRITEGAIIPKILRLAALLPYKFKKHHQNP